MIPLSDLRALPHKEVLKHLRARVDDEERRAHTERLMVQVSRAVISNHQPSATVLEAPCTACREPWPCPTIHSLLADD